MAPRGRPTLEIETIKLIAESDQATALLLDKILEDAELGLSELSNPEVIRIGRAISLLKDNLRRLESLGLAQTRPQN